MDEIRQRKLDWPHPHEKSRGGWGQKRGRYTCVACLSKWSRGFHKRERVCLCRRWPISARSLLGREGRSWQSTQLYPPSSSFVFGQRPLLSWVWLPKCIGSQFGCRLAWGMEMWLGNHYIATHVGSGVWRENFTIHNNFKSQLYFYFHVKKILSISNFSFKI